MWTLVVPGVATSFERLQQQAVIREARVMFVFVSVLHANASKMKKTLGLAHPLNSSVTKHVHTLAYLL